MAKTLTEQDHVDLFLETLRERLPELDLDVEGIVDRIHGLNRRFRRMMELTLADHGLTYEEWGVLNALHLPGPPFRLSPSKLAKRLELTSGAMTARLDGLEEAGLVRRRPDPDDRRGLRIELTEAGKRAFKQAVGAQAEKESFVAAALTDQEKDELNALLRRLMLQFEQNAELDPKAGATSKTM
ncbi:MAG: MarR family transcriptional regulator [Actinomycetota bacterium]|nr:MarR family transcriptional regulator [Actinomycetota bacterium]